MDKKTIAFYGPDGSGKTTLANLVIKHYINEKYIVKKIWIRGFHTIALLIGLFLNKFENMSGDDIPQLGLKLKNKNIWCIVEILSTLPIIIKFKIYKKIYHITLSERSIVDTIVWNLMLYKRNLLCFYFVCSFLFRLLNEYDVLIYLDAKEDILLERRRNENLPKKFIKLQKKLYSTVYNMLITSELAKKSNICYIDTTNTTIKNSFERIKKCIEEI